MSKTDECLQVLCLKGIDPDGQVVELRLRIGGINLPKFLERYDEEFLTVYRKSGIQVLRLVNETGAHFNVSFLFKFESPQAVREFNKIFVDRYVAVHTNLDPKLDPNAAKNRYREVENELIAMIEDDEKTTYLAFKGEQWTYSP